MSLCLLDQKLGSHSQQGSSSDKFSLKGAQTGGMHRGHSWVFRAESHDTMMAWYDDIRILTEKSGPEKTAFIRQHARSVSGGSRPAAPSVSSDGIEDDEADSAPYSANLQQNAPDGTLLAERTKRPEPGGRFPSDFDVSRTNRLQAPLSPSSPSGSSDFKDDGVAAAGASAAAGTVTSSAISHDGAQQLPAPLQQLDGAAAAESAQAPVHQPIYQAYRPSQEAQPATAAQPFPSEMSLEPRTPPKTSHLPSPSENGNVGNDLVAPAVAGAGIGALGGAAATHALQNHSDNQVQSKEELPVQEVESPVQAERPEEPLIANTIDGVVEDSTAVPDFEVVHTAGLHTIAETENAGNNANKTEMSASTQIEAKTANDAVPGDSHAHQTHHIFPSVIRHDTSTSVSQLHVPGEFPASRANSYTKSS